MSNRTVTIPRVEEELIVEKTLVSDAHIEVRTETGLEREALTFDLASEVVEVVRVPRNEAVGEAPPVRTEGTTTIIPVLEERLVVSKQLVLVEEIRIDRRSIIQTESVTADLRKQRVSVERTEGERKPRRTNMANTYSETSTNTAFSSRSGASQLSALFDDRTEAARAVERLKEAGVPADNIRYMPGYEADGRADNVASDDRSGFWAKLEDWFYPDEDRATYAEGLRRGGALVSVSGLNDALYHTAHDILDDDGSIDIDERADTWRSEGWNYEPSTTANAASTYDANRSSRDDTVDARGRETIPVVEENLRVGKRDVSNGSVRVRAYTVEEPVREDLSLRDENVTIERKSVDRPLTDADNAFRDRTISAEEHHEEAVVSKDARVVEEIGIRKEASERTETISDTVRKTEVEVEDNRKIGKGQSGFSESQSFRRD